MNRREGEKTLEIFFKKSGWLPASGHPDTSTRRDFFSNKNPNLVEHSYLFFFSLSLRHLTKTTENSPSIGLALKYIKKGLRGVLAFTCLVYHIWKTCNSFISKSKSTTVDTLFVAIRTFVYRIFFSLHHINIVTL